VKKLIYLIEKKDLIFCGGSGDLFVLLKLRERHNFSFSEYLGTIELEVTLSLKSQVLSLVFKKRVFNVFFCESGFNDDEMAFLST
jgi:hypothetical protein